MRNDDVPRRSLRLYQIAELYTGGTPSRENPAFWNGSIPWITPSDITTGRPIDVQAVEKITQAGLSSSGARLIPSKSLLVTTRATLGARVLTDTPVATNQGVTAVIFDQRKCNPHFYYYIFDRLTAELRMLSRGTTFAEVSAKQLGTISLPVPSLEEQRRIVEVLNAVDKQIDTTRRVLAKMGSVYEGVAADIWRNGREWETRYLGEIASIEPGLTLGSEPVGPSSVELPYLRVANVQNGYIDTTEMKNVRVLRNEISIYATRAGDVLLTEGGDFDKLGRGAVWDGRIEPCLHQNHIFRVRCLTQILIPEFLALYTSSPAGRRYFLGVAKQTTNLASINLTQLKAMPIPVPHLQDQERAFRSVSGVRTQRECVAAELDKLRLLKTGLIEDLLTGRVRVTRGEELTV